MAEKLNTENMEQVSGGKITENTTKGRFFDSKTYTVEVFDPVKNEWIKGETYSSQTAAKQAEAKLRNDIMAGYEPPVTE